MYVFRDISIRIKTSKVYTVNVWKITTLSNRKIEIIERFNNDQIYFFPRQIDFLAVILEYGNHFIQKPVTNQSSCPWPYTPHHKFPLLSDSGS